MIDDDLLDDEDELDGEVPLILDEDEESGILPIEDDTEDDELGKAGMHVEEEPDF